MAGPFSHAELMKLALEQANRAAAMGEVPVGAVVVNAEGEVLAAAHNLRESADDPTGHAELIAMRQAAKAQGHWRLEGCTVVVTLEPCAMCAGAMVLSRIERCVYGAPDPKGGFLGTLDDLSQHPVLNHRFEVVAGVEQDACSTVLKEFFRELRLKKKKG